MITERLLPCVNRCRDKAAQALYKQVVAPLSGKKKRLLSHLSMMATDSPSQSLNNLPESITQSGKDFTEVSVQLHLRTRAAIPFDGPYSLFSI
jgi:hypothetical protein